MSKHTPGPWEIMFGGNFIRIGCAGYKNEANRQKYLGYKAGGIAELDLPGIGRAQDKTARANAHLIAAAPELLNALKAVQALLPADIQSKIESLIAKAETP
jgi:hypothetical protein